MTNLAAIDLPKGTKLGVLEQLEEGRSCHSPSESLEPITDFVQKEENLPDEVSSQVREIPCEEGHCQIGLKRRQEEDPVLGDIVRLRRSHDEVPSQEELSKESDVTKKLCLQWDRLEVVNEVVCRRLPGSKVGEEYYLQLLVPKSDVEEVLRLCQVRKEV